MYRSIKKQRRLLWAFVGSGLTVAAVVGLSVGAGAGGAAVAGVPLSRSRRRSPVHPRKARSSSAQGAVG